MTVQPAARGIETCCSFLPSQLAVPFCRLSIAQVVVYARAHVAGFGIVSWVERDEPVHVS